MAAYSTNPPQELVKNLYEQFIEKFGEEVKPREGNNIRLACPECKHKSLSCNISTGVFHCFHCSFGKGQKLYGPAIGFKEEKVDSELHIKVSNKLLECCPLYDVHKSYLKQRGVHSPEKYKICSVPFNIESILLKHFSKEELANSGYFYLTDTEFRASKALSPRRILVPFWQGSAIIGLKSRANPYGDSDEPRYIAPRGSQIKNRYWYIGKLTSADIIITEGELGAIAGCETGIQTIGIPGIGNISNETLLNELTTHTENCKRKFLILDTDVGIYNDLAKLSLALKATKALPNSCILYLPQDKEDEKMDLDLYINRHGTDNLEHQMELAWKNKDKITEQIENYVKEKTSRK